MLMVRSYDLLAFYLLCVLLFYIPTFIQILFSLCLLLRSHTHLSVYKGIIYNFTLDTSRLLDTRRTYKTFPGADPKGSILSRFPHSVYSALQLPSGQCTLITWIFLLSPLPPAFPFSGEGLKG